jgi:hypothetical protein
MVDLEELLKQLNVPLSSGLDLTTPDQRQKLHDGAPMLLKALHLAQARLEQLGETERILDVIKTAIRLAE